MKTELHNKNKHNQGYDFKVLSKVNPKLAYYMIKSKAGTDTIDFSNQLGVLQLNKALLKAHYGVKFWSLPAGFLCPPIPGRADYIHYLADLLNEGKKKPVKPLKGLDIGVGANLIYPLLGHKIYGWNFIGSEINTESLAWGKHLLEKNPEIGKAIKIRRQKHSGLIFEKIIGKTEKFDFTMCNPPFYASEQDAIEANLRKTKNLNLKQERNFGGVNSELWCNGGEIGFLSNMIAESEKQQIRVMWFTTLVSRKEVLEKLERKIKANKKIQDYRVVTMTQGQKQSRMLAWTFQTKKQMEIWKKDWK
ncbi:MAG: 23S rRNA (adenine(1618)-N(6))-methyltransferase RlmF [Flavobacteriales bacterium]